MISIFVFFSLIYFEPVRDIKKKRNYEFTNSNCCKKAREPFKIPFNGALFLINYFKKHFKGFKRHFVHFEFVN